MARPRKHGNQHLPRYMHEKHGAFYLVRDGKWTRLAENIADALVALAKTMGAVVSGSAPLPATKEASMKMADLVGRALPFVCHGKAYETARNYKQKGATLMEALADVTVAEFKPRHVWLIQEAMINQRGTFNVMLTVLKGTIKWARKRDINVAQITEVAQHRFKPSDRYIETPEYAALYNKATERMQVVMELCYRTGQRIGDVRLIELEHLTEEGICFHTHKVKKKICIAWSPELRSAVERAKAISAEKQTRTTVVKCSKYLLSVTAGRPIAYGTLRIEFAQLVKAAGMTKKTTLHNLRAKAASDIALDHGKEAANAVMAHSTMRQTEDYIRHLRAPIVHGPSAHRARTATVTHLGKAAAK